MIISIMNGGIYVMTKAEMEKQLKEQQEIIDKHKARIKAQNEAAKEKWDTVSCRLPHGTKDRVKALGLTVNGLINSSLLAELDRLEENARENKKENVENRKYPF